MLLDLWLHLHLREGLDVRSEERVDAIREVGIEQGVMLLLDARHRLGLQVLVIGRDAERLIRLLSILFHDWAIGHREIEDDCIYFFSARRLPEVVGHLVLVLLAHALLQTLPVNGISVSLVV